jgi:hypothetical protein
VFSGSDFEVFERYRAAGQHAFSNNLVSDPDKDSYFRIHEALVDSAYRALEATGSSAKFDVWNVRFGRKGGVQGHRPVDLWASIINLESEPFGRYPQVYVIASETGLEIGFTVAIHEDDYYNKEVKLKNRTVVPILYSRLPNSDSEIIQSVGELLEADSHWNYGLKSRQVSRSDFDSLSELVAFLKSGDSTEKGGGSIYRAIDRSVLNKPNFDLASELSQALDRFAPLMQHLTPTPVEANRINNQVAVDLAVQSVPAFDPNDMEEGKKRSIRVLAIRQGQYKFRESLIAAYDGRCAVTGVNVLAVLQAAHIVPYQGTKTNSVQNGILLRADIHNLFDLGLLQISPTDYRVTISEEVSDPTYRKLDGGSIQLPQRDAWKPSKLALMERLKLFD